MIDVANINNIGIKLIEIKKSFFIFHINFKFKFLNKGKAHYKDWN